MAYEAIRVINDSTSRVVTITLNRPDKLNSFTRAMHQEVAAALAEAQTSGARALVLVRLANLPAGRPEYRSSCPRRPG